MSVNIDCHSVINEFSISLMLLINEILYQSKIDCFLYMFDALSCKGQKLYVYTGKSNQSLDYKCNVHPNLITSKPIALNCKGSYKK